MVERYWDLPWISVAIQEGYEGGKTSKGLGFIDGLVDDSSRTFGKNPSMEDRQILDGESYSEDFKQDLDQKYFYFVHRYLLEIVKIIKAYLFLS